MRIRTVDEVYCAETGRTLPRGTEGEVHQIYGDIHESGPVLECEMDGYGLWFLFKDETEEVVL
jgi:hypothetical protein